jgi:YidC/Oxa1 family membrane protein insertase
MKITPKMKKILLFAAVAVFAVGLAGCTVPRDPDTNQIILISNDTTFSSVMSDENWFSAIFVWPLAQWINHMAPTVGVGGAIAVVTIVVNGVLALVTLKSTVATQQMQLIQPEMEKIQRKYEGRDDEASKMRMAQETQKLYKKYNINPLGSMLVMFIQLPIIMAMYMAVQRSYAVAHGYFLGMDLQMTPMQGIQAALGGNATGWMFVLLFAFMGVCQFFSMMTPQIIQKKRAEALAAKQHRKPQEPSKQSKIMQYYMMGMILIFGLMWPAAMALYWAINSLVNIVKTLLVQKYIDKQNAAREA